MYSAQIIKRWIWGHCETLHPTIRRVLLFRTDWRGMDTIIIRYEDDSSVCYNRKEYMESLSRYAEEREQLERYKAMRVSRWRQSPTLGSPSTTTIARVPMSDLNGRSYDVTTTKVSLVDDKLQAILANLRMMSPIQIGLELSKVLFTDTELSVSTLTGCRVHGQSNKTLNPAKLCLIDNLVQQKCGLGEAEFSAVRSGIWDSLAYRCKHLRLKLGPKNRTIIWTESVSL